VRFSEGAKDLRQQCARERQGSLLEDLGGCLFAFCCAARTVFHWCGSMSARRMRICILGALTVHLVRGFVTILSVVFLCHIGPSLPYQQAACGCALPRVDQTLCVLPAPPACCKRHLVCSARWSQYIDGVRCFSTNLPLLAA
jgi:hypothetical protein